MYMIGADPELFLKRGNDYVSAIGRIGGTKYEPRRLLGGFALQEDNVAVEYNIPACDSTEKFIWANTMMLDEIKLIAEAQDLEIALDSSARFSDAELANPIAQMFGCDPDFNAWELEINPRPNATDSNLRSAGGHIHVGLPADTPNTDKACMVMALDLVLGVPLAFMDPESKRRELYGRAGACRFKTYGLEYRTPSNVWLKDEALIKQVGQTIMNFDECWKDLYHFAKEQGERVQRCINTLNEDDFLCLRDAIRSHWPSSLLKKYIKLNKQETEEKIKLIIEE